MDVWNAKTRAEPDEADRKQGWCMAATEQKTLALADYPHAMVVPYLKGAHGRHGCIEAINRPSARHTTPDKRRTDDAYLVRIKLRALPSRLGILSRHSIVLLRGNLPDNRSTNQSLREVYCEATLF